MNPVRRFARWLGETPADEQGAKAELFASPGTVRLLPDSLNRAAPPITMKRMIKEGYRAHATVFACVQMHATMFPEPELHVWQRAEKERVLLADHECRALLAAPNPEMDEAEFWEYVITYAAIGGLAGMWKERDRAGRCIALWPMHRAQIRPLPSPAGWLRGWEYDDGSIRADKLFLPREDVIPLRWAIDPLNPLDGLSPIVACGRAVDQGTEAMRYVYALLRNDAVARTAIIAKNILPDPVRERMKAQFTAKFGSDGAERGGVVVVEGQEADVKRLGANLQELAAEALHDVPDAWITMAFGVPAVLVGTPGGLGRAIQGAPRELQEYWTETNRAPRWRKVAGTMTRHLLKPEFGGKPDELCAFDLSQVAALRDDEVQLRQSVSQAYTAGVLKRGEARARLGLDSGPEDDVYVDLSTGQTLVDTAPTTGTSGAVPTTAGLASLGLNGTQIAQAMQIVSQVTRAEIDADQGLTALQAFLGVSEAVARRLLKVVDAIPAPSAPAIPAAKAKAVSDAERRTAEIEAVAAQAESEIALDLAASARKVASRAREGLQDSTVLLAGLGLGKTIERLWQDAVKKSAASASGGKVAWGKDLPKEVRDMLASRITGIDQTTEDRVASYVARALDTGLSPQELADLIAADPSGAFSASRAATIARTETGTAYNLGTVIGFEGAGVEKVLIFDGDDCGWASHDSSDKANGSVRTVKDFRDHLLAHPNCRRGAAAYFDDESEVKP